MWSEFPFDVLCLYGVDVQPPVAPTLFASARHAWEVLPEDLKESVRDLQAANVSAAEYLPDRRRQAFDGQLLSLHREAVPTTLWPVARTHPRTGQTLLYLSQGTTQGLVGLDPEESEDLIERLFAYLYAPENVLAHEWRNGDLVIWDNHSVQHGRGEVTVDGPARTLRKVALPIVESTIASSIIEAYEPLETGS
jgi:taurine dioxygenase